MVVWCFQDVGQVFPEGQGAGESFPQIRRGVAGPRDLRGCGDETAGAAEAEQFGQGDTRCCESASQRRGAHPEAELGHSEKARRWETYQSELQKSIQQEYHRHLAALDRLEQEIADATSQEENAKELLARAMAGAAAQEPNTQAGKAWASLIAGIPGEAAMDIDADSIGRRLDEFLHAPNFGGPASTPAPASVHVPSQASGPPGLPEPPDTTFGPVRTHTLVDRRVWQGQILICRAALLPLLVVGRSPGLHKRPWLRKTFEPLARYSIAAVGSMCLSLGDLSFCGVAGFCFSHYVGLVSPRASQVGSRQGPFVCERMWR